MKKILVAMSAVLLVAMSVASPARAASQQILGWQNFGNVLFFGTPCSGYTGSAGAPQLGALCVDNSTDALWVWNGSSFVAATGSATIASPLVLSGTTSGSISLSAGATPTAYTLTFKSTVPAQGDLVTYSNGTGQQASIADVATGQVLTSGGTSTVPAYSASPTVTSTTLSGAGNGVLTLSNDGELAAPIGAGTKPTVTSCGSGAASASSTDFAGDVTATGATACTVVFNAAYANKPVVVAVDETTAAGLKVALGGTGNAAQFTVTGLTSGDEFMYMVIGK
jgi:hypothetical protein